MFALNAITANTNANKQQILQDVQYIYIYIFFFWEEKEEQSTIMFFHPWSTEQLFGTTALEIQKTSQNCILESNHPHNKTK